MEPDMEADKINPETEQAEETQPDNTQTEATQPDSSQTEAAHPGSSQTEAVQPDNTQAEAEQPGSSQTEAVQPRSAKKLIRPGVLTAALAVGLAAEYILFDISRKVAMNIISWRFFIFVAVFILIYALTPLKGRWVTILGGSIYFILAVTDYDALRLAIFAVQILLVWAVAMVIRREGLPETAKKALLGVTIILLLAAMIYYKDLSFLSPPPAPMGISYYTLILIGYLLDVRWEKIPSPQKNPLKLMAFVSYFPQMTSGPFSRYGFMEDPLLSGGRLTLKNIQDGLVRFFWGLFKKLVIAERMAVLVSAYFDHKPVPLEEDPYTGCMVFVGACFYAVYVYTDFGGCMDMVTGISQMLSIPLAENFDRPFSSVSLSEIWRRWHMTLGLWLKDYLMYPVLNATPMLSLRSFLREHVSKKASRDIPTYIALLCTWFCVGFWHGGTWKFICGTGLFFFAMIVGGLILSPLFKKLIKLFGIDTTAWSWKVFCRIRTFVLFSLSISMGRYENLTEGLTALKSLFTHFNPWVLFDDTLLTMGLDGKDMNVCVLGLLAVLVVSMVQERHGSVRDFLSRQNLWFRWLVYLALIMSVIILGFYGYGYDPTSFLYGGF